MIQEIENTHFLAQPFKDEDDEESDNNKYDDLESTGIMHFVRAFIFLIGPP
jgi:hypothetical protein